MRVKITATSFLLTRSFFLLLTNLLTLVALLAVTRDVGVTDYSLAAILYFTLLALINTILSMFLIEYSLLAPLNTGVLVLYVTAISRRSLYSPPALISLVVSTIVAMLAKKIGFTYGLPFSYGDGSKLFKGLRGSLVSSLRDLALFFAYLSITYPIAVLTLLLVQTMLQLSLELREVIIVNNYFLAVNAVITVFATMRGICGKEEVLKSSILVSLTAVSTIPLLSYMMGKLRGFLIERSKPTLLSSSTEEAVVFGKTISRLTYGHVTKPYEKVFEYTETGRKTWYWRVEEGFLAVNPKLLPNRHILIMGSSGSGKSLLVKHLAIEFHSKFGYKLLIFDPHAEYIVLSEHVPNLLVIDASTTSINPLELGGSNPRERSNQLAHIISSIFKLGSLQRSALEELFMKTYEQAGIIQEDPSTFRNKPPAIHDALALCEKLMVNNDVYRRVYPYLKFLTDNVFSQTTINLNEILEQNVVFVLNKLKSDYVRFLYVDTFLHKLLEAMYRNEVSGEHLVVLDEAYVLTSREYERRIVTRLLVESRKYNIGIIFVTQNPLSTPIPIVENAAVKISFNISEPRNLEYVAKILAGSMDRDKLDAVMRAIRSLDTLNYVVSFSGIDELYMVSEKGFIDKLIG